MSALTPTAPPPLRVILLGRVRNVLAAAGAAIFGAAPHVLHHVGPLAGAAWLAGATGRVAFGLAGFIAVVPMLRRLRRRTGSWRMPAAALAAMAAVFTVSSLVIGPAVTGGDDADADRPAVTRPVPEGHDTHHP